MFLTRSWSLLFFGIFVLSGRPGAAALGDEPVNVISLSPAPHLVNVAPDSAITIRFDKAVDPASVNRLRFWAFGRWSGSAAGQISNSPDCRNFTLTPDFPFAAGERVMVILADSIRALDGSFLRPGGYSYQFWVRSKSTTMDFSESARHSTRGDNGALVRSYGGIASDLNGDRFSDITVVNEIGADLRVLMNRADGSGLFFDFQEPTFAVGTQASPSEPADFNRDDLVDIAVANIAVASVSVLLGQGDGSFGPQQEIPVGNAPRGIAVLDVDGDGDIDIVNTNANGNNMSILLNNGQGVFGVPQFFESGGNGEWALAVAEMNGDGFLDLVIGTRSGRQVVVNTGDGQGGFSFASSRSNAGAVWNLVTGDLNGDGFEDVTTSNSIDNTGGVLLGDGNGGLASPVLYPVDPLAISTDVGDLDGDGDLDWVVSSFNGDFFLFRNKGLGQGQMTFVREFPADIAASCALLFDLDNDGGLDLGLIDETADMVVLWRNSGDSCPAFFVALEGWGESRLDIISLITTLTDLCILPLNLVEETPSSPRIGAL